MWWLILVQERKVQSKGLPEVHHKGRGSFEAWGWRGSDRPWELSELGGEISELWVRESAEMRTGQPARWYTAGIVWIDFFF